MGKVIKIVKRVVVKVVKRKKNPSDPSAEAPAKRPKLEEGESAVEAPLPAATPMAKPTPKPVSAPAAKQKSKSTASEAPAPDPSVEEAAPAPPAPVRRTPVCHLKGYCNASSVVMQLVCSALPGVQTLRLRRGSSHPGAILHFTTPQAAHEAAGKNNKVLLCNIPFALDARTNPRQLFLVGDLRRVLEAAFVAALGDVVRVDWEAGLMAATIAFGNRADADRALAQKQVEVVPGVSVELEATAAQARLFLDLPKLLHLAAAEALPGLTRVQWSPSMKTAIATFWGIDAAKTALKAGKATILGREVTVKTRKGKILGYDGEFE